MTDRLRGSEWEVRPTAPAVGRVLIYRHHYARGCSNTVTYCHGLFRVGDRATCYGVAWWLPPTRKAAEATWAGPFTEVLSLSRLVVAPGVPKNAATFLMMRSVRLIRESKAQWRCLVTYADEWRGHTGHIYKAAGWEPCGKTQPEGVWVDGDGRMVARKAGPKTRTRSEMESLGYQLAGRFAKHKFRLVIRPIRPAPGPSLFAGAEC